MGVVFKDFIQKGAPKLFGLIGGIFGFWSIRIALFGMKGPNITRCLPVEPVLDGGQI